MQYYLAVIGKCRDRHKRTGMILVVTRIAAGKQHIDGPVLVDRVLIHRWIVRRIE